jgi:malate dehydrogenase
MKVSIIGSGEVGATTAIYIAERGLSDITLIDIIEGMPHGKALDLMEASPLRGFASRVVGSNSYKDVAGSGLIVVTAGVARRSGMSRADLLEKNVAIVRVVVENIVKYCPSAKILVVTNPVDALTYLALKASGFGRERVFGMAGVLDSARFRYFLAEELGVSVSDTTAMVIGSHDEQMVPLPQYARVRGVPITDLMSDEDIKRAIERTRQAGSEIVRYLKAGSASFAPAASICKMVEAVVQDKKELLPVSVYLEGEYGLSDLCIGVPVKLGREGVEQIVELELTLKEREALHRSARALKERIAMVDKRHLLL